MYVCGKQQQQQQKQSSNLIILDTTKGDSLFHPLAIALNVIICVPPVKSL